MAKIATCFLFCLLGLCIDFRDILVTALPNPIDLPQVQGHEISDEGFVEPELTAEERAEIGRYDPARSNVYHLFTRGNRDISQPLLINNPVLLQMTNFNRNRRTIVLLHGSGETATADSNAVLMAAFLEVEDVNVIVVDWSQGASALTYRVLNANTILSGREVANFINWLNKELGYGADQYHIVGHGHGGHQAGIIGRNVDGDIAYITGLDPANIGWVNNFERFRPSDGAYTEVIHTNYAMFGYLADLAQVDFYPNGGTNMRGCSSNACDHARSYFYFAESIISGGFTGVRCLSYLTAVVDNCNTLPGTLQMGGRNPKTGSRGVYYLDTRYIPPFSRG